MTSIRYTSYFTGSPYARGYSEISNYGKNPYSLIKKARAPNGGTVAIKSIDFEYSLKELDVLSRFRHPHLIYSREIYLDDYARIVLPYPDDDATYFMKDIGQKAAFETKVRLVYEIISALDFLQKNGILHCDIKPDNIFLFNLNEEMNNVFAVIGDLNLVRYFNYDNTSCQTYAAPEELLRSGKKLYKTEKDAKKEDEKKVVEKEDVRYDQTKVAMYALAVTMMEILSGKYIQNNKVGDVEKYVYYLNDKPEALFNSMGLPEEWRDLFLAMTSSDIDKRPATFAEILRHPQFSNRSYGSPISGNVLSYSPPKVCDRVLLRGLRLGIEEMIRLNVSPAAGSIFIELMYRIYPLFLDRKLNTADSNLLVSTLVYLANEIVDHKKVLAISDDNLIVIKQVLRQIFVQLRGIIYTDNIYWLAFSAQSAQKLFQIALKDCNLYISLPLKVHVLNLEYDEKPFEREKRGDKEKVSLEEYVR